MCVDGCSPFPPIQNCGQTMMSSMVTIGATLRKVSKAIFARLGCDLWRLAISSIFSTRSPAYKWQHNAIGTFESWHRLHGSVLPMQLWEPHCRGSRGSFLAVGPGLH